MYVTFINLVMRRMVGKVSSLSSGAKTQKKRHWTADTADSVDRGKGPLTDDLPVILGLQQQVEGQPAAGQLAGQRTLPQQIGALLSRGRRDSLVGVEMMKEASRLQSQQSHFNSN